MLEASSTGQLSLRFDYADERIVVLQPEGEREVTSSLEVLVHK